MRRPNLLRHSLQSRRNFLTQAFVLFIAMTDATNVIKNDLRLPRRRFLHELKMSVTGPLFHWGYLPMIEWFRANQNAKCSSISGAHSLELRGFANRTSKHIRKDAAPSPPEKTGPATGRRKAGRTGSQTLEAGIATTLPPGQYTALLAGLNNGTGIGVVEIYDRGP